MKTNKNLFKLEDFSANYRKSMFIEASAGTGKTYTITGIVENLVKNAKIPLEKILIVTYTEKAVGELKDRIRSRLTNIPDCHADVDNAPIYTIHSFCQKTLDEFAFTAEQPFSLSLVNESEIGDFIDRWIRDNLATNTEFEKLYFDIAGDPEPVQLKMLQMVAADDRIVYGSDFPHSPARVVVSKKKHFDENKEYDGIREKIYSENAVRLLK